MEAEIGKCSNQRGALPPHGHTKKGFVAFQMSLVLLAVSISLVFVPGLASANCGPDNPQETYTIRIYNSDGLVNVQYFGQIGNGQTVTLVGGCSYTITANSIAS